MDGNDLMNLRERLLMQPRYADKRCLVRHGQKVFSQGDEDGMIREIFRRIGVRSKTFVEFGVGDGRECNSLWLLFQGWSGLWIEGSSSSCEQIELTHQHYISPGLLKLANEIVTVENIDGILSAHLTPKEVDLLSIDIDNNDYWVWKQIETVSPRVVVIEYNATWMLPASIVVPYNPKAIWDGTSYFGASLGALCALAAQKGYALVGCSLTGVNAFFVRQDLVNDYYFLNPGSVATHYEPARYALAQLPSGHRPGVGPVVHV